MPLKANTFFLFFLLFLSSIAFLKAENNDTSIQLKSKNQERLLIDNLNISVSQFKAAYFGKNRTQRNLAEMYLIGVLDSSEGKVWCDYNNLLPHSVAELIYSGFKEYNWHFPSDERASVAILSVMSKFSPCKGVK